MSLFCQTGVLILMIIASRACGQNFGQKYSVGAREGCIRAPSANCTCFWFRYLSETCGDTQVVWFEKGKF